MEFAFTLGSELLTLKAPDPSFCSAFQRALNVSYPQHSEFLPWARVHTTEEQALESLLRVRDDFRTESGERRLFIVSADGQSIIGCIGLKPRQRDRFVVGYWVNTAFAGKGYMRAGLGRLVRGLPGSTFYLTTSSANVRSQRLAEAAGFVLVRIHPQARHSQRHGVQDTLVYRFDANQKAKKSPRESRGRTVVS